MEQHCICFMNQFHDIEFEKFKNKCYKGIYSLLAIDTKMVNNCEFSYDTNAEDCVWTCDNIPSDAISVVCEIEQSYLE